MAFAAARWLHFDARQAAGFILAVTFVNAGNYGLGVNRLAFGAEAEARAIIYFVTSSVLVYTVGVLIATGFKGGWRGMLKQLTSMPHIYVLLAVLIIRSTGWQVPEPILEGINFPAQAAIPMMLLLLGIQLAGVSVGQYRRPALVGSVISLLMAPLVAFGLAGADRPDGIGASGGGFAGQHAGRGDQHSDCDRIQCRTEISHGHGGHIHPA